MQAATASMPSGGDSTPPQAGDGFTFEHLADRPELWLDFCADTGDGGNPTYAVARAMAAPSLKVGPSLGCSLFLLFNVEEFLLEFVNVWCVKNSYNYSGAALMLGGPPVPLLAALSLEVIPCVKFAWHNAL